MRPAASTPVAWMCPCAQGQIHTSFQAGGMPRLAQPLDDVGLVDRLAVLVEIGEAAAAPDAPETGT